MTIIRTKNGYLEISDILGGKYVSMLYLYYSKQEALKLFKKKYSKYYHKNGHKKCGITTLFNN
tara:strand:+ start:63 stop:251 length:189 start_codon:yes stop_codon:yes gene_type:complete